ncbi:MAG: hypothetical protein R6V55_16645 [Desulfovermiculus sp.]
MQQTYFSTSLRSALLDMAKKEGYNGIGVQFDGLPYQACLIKNIPKSWIGKKPRMFTFGTIDSCSGKFKKTKSMTEIKDDETYV